MNIFAKFLRPSKAARTSKTLENLWKNFSPGFLTCLNFPAIIPDSLKKFQKMLGMKWARTRDLLVQSPEVYHWAN